MISNPHVQVLLKQLFPSETKQIQPNDFLNFYLKQGKISTSNASDLSLNEEILTYFQEKDKSISRNSFMKGLPLCIQYYKEQIAKKQETINNYETLFAKDEKKFEEKIRALSGIDNLYPSKFSLKLIGIFEINFDVMNVTKNYFLGFEEKQFLIDFSSLKEEILEFNNYVAEINGLNQKSIVDVFLCTEKGEFVSKVQINLAYILDQNIHKKVYFFMTKNKTKVCSLLLKTMFIRDYVRRRKKSIVNIIKKREFYQEKIMKYQKIYNKLINELNEHIQELTMKLKNLDAPTNPFVFLKNLDIIYMKKKKPLKKPEKIKSPKEFEKNVVSLENSIYEEETQKNIFLGKHEEEELEFCNKANRMLSIDCLPEYNFLDESSLRRNSPAKHPLEDLDFDLSSIQGDRESQITIFWLDNPDVGVNSPLHIDDKIVKKTAPRTTVKKNSTPLNRYETVTPAIKITMSENRKDEDFKAKGGNEEDSDHDLEHDSKLLLNANYKEKNRNLKGVMKINSNKEKKFTDLINDNSERSSDTKSPNKEHQFFDNKISNFEEKTNESKKNPDQIKIVENFEIPIKTNNFFNDETKENNSQKKSKDKAIKIEKITEKSSESLVKSLEKTIEKDLEKNTEKNIEKKIVKKGIEKSIDKNTGKNIEKNNEKYNEKNNQKSNEKIKEKNIEKIKENNNEKKNENSIEKIPVPAESESKKTVEKKPVLPSRMKTQSINSKKEAVEKMADENQKIEINFKEEAMKQEEKNKKLESQQKKHKRVTSSKYEHSLNKKEEQPENIDEKFVNEQENIEILEKPQKNSIKKINSNESESSLKNSEKKAEEVLTNKLNDSNKKIIGLKNKTIPKPNEKNDELILESNKSLAGEKQKVLNKDLTTPPKQEAKEEKILNLNASNKKFQSKENFTTPKKIETQGKNTANLQNSTVKSIYEKNEPKEKPLTNEEIRSSEKIGDSKTRQNLKETTRKGKQESMMKTTKIDDTEEKIRKANEEENDKFMTKSLVIEEKGKPIERKSTAHVAQINLEEKSLTLISNEKDILKSSPAKKPNEKKENEKNKSKGLEQEINKIPENNNVNKKEIKSLAINLKKDEILKNATSKVKEEETQKTIDQTRENNILIKKPVAKKIPTQNLPEKSLQEEKTIATPRGKIEVIKVKSAVLRPEPIKLKNEEMKQTPSLKEKDLRSQTFHDPEVKKVDEKFIKKQEIISISDTKKEKGKSNDHNDQKTSIDEIVEKRKPEEKKNNEPQLKDRLSQETNEKNQSNINDSTTSSIFSTKKSNLKSNNNFDNALKNKTVHQRVEIAEKESEKITTKKKFWNLKMLKLNSKESELPNRMSSPALFSRKSSHFSTSIDQKMNFLRPTSPSSKFSIGGETDLKINKSLMFLGLVKLMTPRNLTFEPKEGFF